MKEKSIVSAATLVASMLAYWYAKETDKDPVPYVMFGGFLGSILGETIVDRGKGNKNSN